MQSNSWRRLMKHDPTIWPSSWSNPGLRACTRTHVSKICFAGSAYCNETRCSREVEQSSALRFGTEYAPHVARLQDLEPHLLSNLEPELPEFRLEDHSLRIQSYYPGGLKFTVGPF